jgi:BirA family transcriptional regulator, biotin operon repressor / biotin---[acetyl-CoA-carboxylase] ligase
MLACERLEFVDSTQRELQRRLGPSSQPSAVWTTRQTAGMGSHGRPWKDSPDGFAWSVAWPAGAGPVQAQAWPARLSLMALEVIESLYPSAKDRLGVKWPNDVMLAQGKLCGVLVSQHRVGQCTWLIAGIGINLSWPIAPGLDRPVADLRSLGVVADPAVLAQRLCTAIASLWSMPIDLQWSAEFSRRDIFLGQPVAVVHPHTGEVLHSGLHQGIDAQGRLLLFSEGRLVPVQIGELSLRSMEQVT